MDALAFIKGPRTRSLDMDILCNIELFHYNYREVQRTMNRQCEQSKKHGRYGQM